MKNRVLLGVTCMTLTYCLTGASSIATEPVQSVLSPTRIARPLTAAPSASNYVTISSKGFCTNSTRYVPTPLALTLPAASATANAAIITVNIGAFLPSGGTVPGSKCKSFAGAGGSMGVFVGKSTAPLAAVPTLGNAGAAGSLVTVISLTQAPQTIRLQMRATAAASGGVGVGISPGYPASISAQIISCNAQIQNCQQL